MRSFRIVDNLQPIAILQQCFQLRQQLAWDAPGLPGFPRQPKLILPHRKSDRFVCGNLRQEFFHRFRRFQLGVVPVLCRLRRTQLLQEAVKLQFAIDHLQCLYVRRLGLQTLHGPLHRDGRIDGSELLTQQNLVAMVLQALPIHLALHFSGTLQGVFH